MPAPRRATRSKAPASPRAALPAKAPKARARAGEARPKGAVKPARSSYKAKTAGPTSTESPRLRALHGELDRRVRARFPDAEPVFLYEMHGWRVPRRRQVEWSTGTIDPNWLFVGVAERAAGITLHLWDPVQWDVLARNAAPLEEAGFKVMKGCVQFTRKSEYPVDAVDALLARIQEHWHAERAAP